MIEFIEKHWQWILTGPVGVVLVFGAKWYNDRIEDRVRMAVMQAVAEINSDIGEVREKVATLGAHYENAKEDIGEIKSKIDTMLEHIQDIPDKVAAAMRKR